MERVQTKNALAALVLLLQRYTNYEMTFRCLLLDVFFMTVSYG